MIKENKITEILQFKHVYKVTDYHCTSKKLGALSPTGHGITTDDASIDLIEILLKSVVFEPKSELSLKIVGLLINGMFFEDRKKESESVFVKEGNTKTIVSVDLSTNGDETVYSVIMEDGTVVKIEKIVESNNILFGVDGGGCIYVLGEKGKFNEKEKA